MAEEKVFTPIGMHWVEVDKIYSSRFDYKSPAEIIEFFNDIIKRHGADAKIFTVNSSSSSNDYSMRNDGPSTTTTTHYTYFSVRVERPYYSREDNMKIALGKLNACISASAAKHNIQLKNPADPMGFAEYPMLLRNILKLTKEHNDNTESETPAEEG